MTERRGLSLQEIHFLTELGVPSRTLRDWRKKGVPKRYITLLLQWISDGAPPTNDAFWWGWRFIEDTLVSPEGLHFTPDDLRYFAYLRQTGSLRF